MASGGEKPGNGEALEPTAWERVRDFARGPEPPPSVIAAHADDAGPPRGRRKALVWVVVVLAAVFLLVSSLTIWIERQVLDTDNWVETSGQLLEDESIRELTADALVEAVFENANVQDQLAETLPEEFRPLAPQATALAQNLATDAAERLLALPQTQTLWEEANRTAHEQLVAVLREENTETFDVSGGTITLDLAPLAERLASQIGVQAELPEGAAQVTLVESGELDAAQTGVQILDFLSVFIFLVVIALLALAVWLATGIRREMLRNIGWTWVIVGILLLIVQRVAGDALIESITNAQTLEAGEAVWDIGTRLLRELGWAIVAYGLAAVVAAWIAGPSRWAIALRAAVAPTVRERPAVAYGAVVVIFLLFVLFGPSGGVQDLLGIVILAALFAVGVYFLRRQVLREFPAESNAGGPPSGGGGAPGGQTGPTQTSPG